jgi:quinol monooxygenase YgiN
VTHQPLSCLKRECYPLLECTGLELMRHRYKDKAAIDAHGKTDYFKNMGKAMKKEDLLAGPMKVMITKEVGGYVSKL